MDGETPPLSRSRSFSVFFASFVTFARHHSVRCGRGEKECQEKQKQGAKLLPHLGRAERSPAGVVGFVGVIQAKKGRKQLLRKLPDTFGDLAGDILLRTP